MKERTSLEAAFDPKQFASLQPIQLAQTTPYHVPSARKRRKEFLRGPIPLGWLHKAAQLRGKALAVGIALWFKAGVTKQFVVKASNTLWSKLGINRKSAYRALTALEHAGLVSVERHAGRAPVVKILDLNSFMPEEGDRNYECDESPWP
jgi:hypothetical protein